MKELPRRNVLFITADQWRGDSLSALGHTSAATPHLDALAADGVLFRNHFSQSSPCGPARTSLLTGLYQMNHRSVRNGTPLDARHSNLALEVRKGGYDPILFGYTDTSPDPRLRPPGDPALLTYSGVLPGMSTGCAMGEDLLPWRRHLKSRGYEIPEEPLDIFKAAGRSAAPDGSFTSPHTAFSAEESDAAFIADQALHHLSLPAHEPWFLHLVFLRPHPPLIAPQPYNTLCNPAQVARPRRAGNVEQEAEQHPYLAYILDHQKTVGSYAGHETANKALSEAQARELAATYYGLIAEVDHQVGRILSFLKDSGQYDDTLIIFTSDHGEMLGNHWLWGKEGYFDDAFHVPLILRDPRAEAGAGRGQILEALTEAVDVAPTILDWLGLEVPPAFDGRSLLPFLEGEAPADWRAEAHWEFDFRDLVDGRPEAALGLTSDECSLNVIRGRRYKYVHFAALPPLLFDLEEDPGESRNLACDPAHLPTLLEMAQKMLSWRMIYDERVLTNTLLTAAGLVERRGPRQRRG